jgi:methylated-DNA-[protein]-cysteine S-methyltransferase
MSWRSRFRIVPMTTSENREQIPLNVGNIPAKDLTRYPTMTSFMFKLERMPTPCGELLLATDDEGALRALDWSDHEVRVRQLLRLQYPKHTVQWVSAPERASDARSALKAYLSGDLDAIDAIAVGMGGTPFQREVWSALRKIPVGETVSYGELALRLNRPCAVRAVGMANGANPISIVVPCHRVIGADGSLTGYGAGLPRKRWLLEHEGVQLTAHRRAA